MKNIDLLGCGIISLLVATPAFAEKSPVDLNLGGFFKGYISYISQSEPNGNVHKVDLLRQTEVHFSGKTAINNQLTIGLHIEGQADGDDDFFLDESYLSATSPWGEVYLGRAYGSPYMLQVSAPAADSNIDGRRQMIQPVNFSVAGISLGSSTETDYDHDVSAKHDKITYISPDLNGIQVGFAYTPESDASSRGANGNAPDNDDTLPSSQIMDAAIRFENDITDSVSYKIGAGYSKAQTEIGSNPNREAWNIGLDFDIQKFGIGAAYQVDDLGNANKNATYTAFGMDYKMDDMTYATSYYRKDDDVNSVDLKRYTTGLSYKVIPGLSLRSSLAYFDIKDVDSQANATSFVIGTDITF